MPKKIPRYKAKKRIRGVLLEQDMYVTELADAAGYSRGWVSGIVNGTTLVTYETAKTLADTLGKTVGILFSKEDK